MVIRRGTSKMRWDRRTSRTKGWHTFSEDCDAVVITDRRTYQTLLVVDRGPDRGTYLMWV